MQPKATQPVNVVTTVRVIQRLRIVEVFPQAIPIFEEHLGQWRRAAVPGRIMTLLEQLWSK